MKTIKEAADSLLSRNEITQDEYNLVKESGLLEEKDLTKEAVGKFKKALVGLRKKFVPLKFGAVSAALTGAGIVAGKEMVYDPIKSKLEMSKSLKELPSKVPQLQEKDPEQIKEYFNVVKTFSPKAASNPLVAGALVNKMMEFGGVDHKLVQDISAIQTGLQRPSIVQAATESAAKSISAIP